MKRRLKIESFLVFLVVVMEGKDESRLGLEY